MIAAENSRQVQERLARELETRLAVEARRQGRRRDERARLDSYFSAKARARSAIE
jgi:hypothetical protein